MPYLYLKCNLVKIVRDRIIFKNIIAPLIHLYNITFITVYKNYYTTYIIGSDGKGEGKEHVNAIITDNEGNRTLEFFVRDITTNVSNMSLNVYSLCIFL